MRERLCLFDDASPSKERVRNLLVRNISFLQYTNTFVYLARQYKKICVCISGTAITNAQQCLLGKEAVWLRERPMFEGSNEPRIEVLSCHQSLLHGKKRSNKVFVIIFRA